MSLNPTLRSALTEALNLFPLALEGPGTQSAHLSRKGPEGVGGANPQVRISPPEAPVTLGIQEPLVRVGEGPASLFVSLGLSFLVHKMGASTVTLVGSPDDRIS